MKQINTNDLILDAIIKNSGAYDIFYTLVCRADKNKPHQWNLIPETDITITYRGEADYCIRKENIREVMKWQSVRYPQINQLRESLKTEIEQFNTMVRATSADAQFTKIK